MKQVIVRRVLIAGLGPATLAKLYLAATTSGTDVAGYTDQLHKIRSTSTVPALVALISFLPLAAALALMLLVWHLTRIGNEEVLPRTTDEKP